MEEGVQGKPPNPSPSPLFTLLSFGRWRSIFSKPEGWGIQNPPMLGTSGCNYARGFHIFILILRLIGKISQESKIMCGTICNSFRTQCAYFFHRKTSVANQTHFRI